MGGLEATLDSMISYQMKKTIWIGNWVEVL